MKFFVYFQISYKNQSESFTWGNTEIDSMGVSLKKEEEWSEFIDESFKAHFLDVEKFHHNLKFAKEESLLVFMYNKTLGEVSYYPNRQKTPIPPDLKEAALMLLQFYRDFGWEVYWDRVV